MPDNEEDWQEVVSKSGSNNRTFKHKLEIYFVMIVITMVIFFFLVSGVSRKW